MSEIVRLVLSMATAALCFAIYFIIRRIEKSGGKAKK